MHITSYVKKSIVFVITPFKFIVSSKNFDISQLFNLANTFSWS